MATTVKSKVQNFKKSSQAPLLPEGTNKSQRRRSRSRSGQRMAMMESELVRKVDEYPVVHNTVEYLMSTYGVIKDANPLLKASLQRSEDTAFWMKRQTDAVLAATKLDEPLKRLDSAAASSLTAVEERTQQLRTQLEQSNAQLNSRVRNISSELKKKGENVRYQILETIQTLLDHVEDRLEPVMLPPSKEALKYSEDTSLGLTLKRILDINYRLNVGTVRYSINLVKDVMDPQAWRAFLHKNFHPGQVQSRFLIVRKEIMAPIGQSPNYISNKELTELDRRIISASRMLIETTSQLHLNLRDAAATAGTFISQSFLTTTDVLKQLVEARSLRDVSGIGYHETHRALQALAGAVPFMRENIWVNAVLDWLTEQEKALALD